MRPERDTTKLQLWVDRAGREERALRAGRCGDHAGSGRTLRIIIRSTAETGEVAEPGVALPEVLGRVGDVLGSEVSAPHHLVRPAGRFLVIDGASQRIAGVEAAQLAEPGQTGPARAGGEGQAESVRPAQHGVPAVAARH